MIYLIVAAVWLVLSLGAALVLAAMIALADRMQSRTGADNVSDEWSGWAA
jgi:hypothetical protein